ncbi:uncharacterized protein LOC111087142 [Limulus polyphemus]|uniref:Uncharacterized protein LOC111087142 n=1 Tax=Limulus polyphemus TaxID=6850 RepID=A0ABM1SXV2_LIMPO|nr:uncharacterized protein LOC111087142 [Limulus polyphemus]
MLKRTRVRDIDGVEMEAFLGIVLLAGNYHRNKIILDDLWNTDGMGADVFRATMSLHCFRFLLVCIRYDDKATRSEHKLVDKLAPFKDLFVDNCVKNYSPSEFVNIIEFRGKCTFRQYIPNKPTKYGIKIQAMTHTKTFYVCKMEVYTCRQPDGPFKVDNSHLPLVLRLISDISGSDRNVTFDNWYTSYRLIHKLIAVGTLRKNKKEIPGAFLQVKDLPPHDSMFGFEENVILVSYIPSNQKGKKKCYSLQ